MTKQRQTDAQARAAAKSHLGGNFYAFPAHASQSLTRAELRETLLATGGWVMACGGSWNIKSKHLGAGVYEVRLEPRR